MSYIALAPQSNGSHALHLALPPPPHSSVKTILVPSLLNVAECQYAKPVSVTTSNLVGLYGSLISKSMPFPEHAPAAMFKEGNTVMS